MTARWKCPKCATEYFSPGECDWCSGAKLEPRFAGDCKAALSQAYEYIKKLELKAKRWDAVVLSCHRMGGQCTDVIKAVIEKVRS